MKRADQVKNHQNWKNEDSRGGPSGAVKLEGELKKEGVGS